MLKIIKLFLNLIIFLIEIYPNILIYMKSSFALLFNGILHSSYSLTLSSYIGHGESVTLAVKYCRLLPFTLAQKLKI